MKPLLRTNQKFNQAGFTLIEILIALFLVALVMGLAISNPFSGNQDLENEVKDLERAVSFMSDEAALRNSVTRLHLYLSKDPQEYSIEYGPSSQFVLPAVTESEINIVTKEEEEKKKKELKELNMKFSRISEFLDSNKIVNQDVKILAVGNSQSSQLQTSGEFSIYSFPSGEKDEVFIVLAQGNSVATITTSAFSSKIVHNYYHLKESEITDPQESYTKKAKELFEIWFKEKK